MLAVAYSDLETYLQASHQEFVLNLSNATLLQVIEEFYSFKHLRKPSANCGGLVYHLSKYKNIMPVQITDMFWSLFQKELLDEGLLPSTIDTYCYQLKAALEWGGKHGCILSTTYGDFERHEFSKPKVALTMDEISHIYHFKVEKLKCRADHRKNLERVRDMFVLSCSLGQRYSDMIRVSEQNFTDKHIFKILQQKTANEAVVDTEQMSMDKRVVKEILEKYNYSAPYSGDISNYNKMLKELLRYIGEEFNDTVFQEYHDGDKVVSKEYVKWTRIASHTARRTFATQNRKRHTDREVMKATGHKDIRTLEIYTIDGI